MAEQRPGSLVVERADFGDPALAAFLQGHLDELAPTAPAESRHALDLAALQHPHVRLWVAREAGRIVGTVALTAVEPRHEELKSMRTDPALRGRGLGRALLSHALADAAGRGVHRVSLETGSAAFFSPARSLYAAAGFVACPPFGSYRADPHSIFLTRTLGGTGVQPPDGEVRRPGRSAARRGGRAGW